MIASPCLRWPPFKFCQVSQNSPYLWQAYSQYRSNVSLRIPGLLLTILAHYGRQLPAPVTSRELSYPQWPQTHLWPEPPTMIKERSPNTNTCVLSLALSLFLSLSPSHQYFGHVEHLFYSLNFSPPLVSVGLPLPSTTAQKLSWQQAGNHRLAFFVSPLAMSKILHYLLPTIWKQF